MQILLDALLADCRRPINLIAKVDNTQAITAVHKGYTKKLRFLERTHECSIGTLHVLVEAGQLLLDQLQPILDRLQRCLLRVELPREDGGA